MLLVSDVLKNKIYKWTAGKGKELYLESSCYTQTNLRGEELGSNGLALNHKGQLLLCKHGDWRIAIVNAPLNNPKAVFSTLASAYQNKKFNSPNDLTVKGNGDIYFTYPPYGLEKGMTDPAKETPFQGVYKISKNGCVTLLTDTFNQTKRNCLFFG